MQFICNELSFLPLAETPFQVEERFLGLLKTFKAAKERYQFSHIRFPVNYATQKVTTLLTYYEWVSIIKNRNLQALLLDLCKPPYSDDLRKDELDLFFQSSYTIIDEGVPPPNDPIGLPIAFIKANPSISLYTHDFWLKKKINLRKSNGNPIEDTDFFVYNICREEDVVSLEMDEWANVYMSKSIDSKELLATYLGYNKFTVDFSHDFMEQLIQWKTEKVDTFRNVLLLMKDVELHPFSGGMGQTENLKNRGKEASKRITINDRLSYTITNNNINFIACKGHYTFH